MSEDRTPRKIEMVNTKPEQIEEHGVLHDVVVPIAASGVGGVAAGAANAYVSHLLQSEPREPSSEADSESG